MARMLPCPASDAVVATLVAPDVDLLDADGVAALIDRSDAVVAAAQTLTRRDRPASASQRQIARDALYRRREELADQIAAVEHRIALGFGVYRDLCDARVTWRHLGAAWDRNFYASELLPR